MSAVPRPLTPLLGREEDVAAVCKLLETTRLLTLTGAGGSGKTRLASEVAARASQRFADSVSWVELAPLVNAELLRTYVVDGLGVEPGARAPMAALLDTLRDREMLLVLDNCEHLVEGCAALVDALLRECERVTVLATSREALGVGGERAWLVPGLALPPATSHSVDNVSESAAVQLFVDRAQAAVASFQLTPKNAAAVAQICRRLDGLPLAIELAAARVRTLPPEELAPRLDDVFRVLSSGSRTAVPRHRTLREAIEWSYNLLDQRERVLLQRLSVFFGDFTLNAAESVGADADLDAGDVLDALGALLDKSLVAMNEQDGVARFYLLETIRQYANAKLSESGEYRRVCERHARAYMDLAAAAAPHLITRERPAWVERIQRELDNIRVALNCTRKEAIGDHLELLGDLGWFWYSSGHWSEARRWYDAAIALPWTDDMGRARAAVLLGASVIASLQGQPQVAVPWLEESVTLFRSVGDRSGEAYALAYHGVSYGQQRDARTVEPTTLAMAYFREQQDLYGLRLCLVVLSTYYGSVGEMERARDAGREAVEVARAYGLNRELAIALQVFAAVNMNVGDFAGAEPSIRESLAALQRDPSVFWTARGLQQLGIVNFHVGDADRGAFLMGSAEVARESIGSNFFGPDFHLIENAIGVGRAAMGESAFDAAWKTGRAAPLEQVMEEEARVLGRRTPAVAAPAVASAPALEVRSLAGGRLEILRDGQPLPADAWRYAKPRELLLYLLCHPEGRTRDQIGVVFWPDASATQVKNSFHVMLHHVRKTIGRADLIVFSGERYRIAWELGGGVVFDARALDESVRRGMRALKDARHSADEQRGLDVLRDAIALYRGDFLDGEDAGDWHFDIRDRLRRLFGDAVMLLGQRCLDRGENREAADAFRRVVEVDELHEEAYRRLMLALTRAGQRSEALRQYERLSQALQSDLDAEPERETKALYERLRRAEMV
ncbi:MAG: BTAD domain-containing putative transcriptional regulator [Gemmatimonadaceae bacterium]